MSVRGYISAFDLGRLRSLFGSRDESVVGEAARFLEERYLKRVPPKQRERWAQAVQRVVTSVRRAVFEGVPLPDVDRETPAHAEAAQVLARVRQSPLATSFADWKVYSVFPAFWTDYGGELAEPDRQLLAHLVNGRTLFGRARSDEEGYYAYLDNSEVLQLAHAFERLRSRHDRLKGDAYHDGFVDDLVRALREVGDGGHDLWFDAG